ncbi:hypothetical protein vB_RpoS-V16_06 [Ruegeria phage vB_RpoS-V16]|uniref:hypothetical protein n=1 Tax=Ruegeria phage vB_RpoS-V16 TaxID=2218618 RepID=UPI000DCACF66|nr:hypothetical protein JT311_gp06 [Ruegeria phage vB_RpoS-V16]AWY09442.1 hypothetical protein vB_RpoS-V16_06 [Ruegeria phage vB_RpoS-V16]
MKLDALFLDAHRRVCIARQRQDGGDLSETWVGLCFPSEMKKAREFFRPLHGEETKRTLTWYLFTPAGLAEYQKRYNGKPDYFAKESDA